MIPLLSKKILRRANLLRRKAFATTCLYLQNVDKISPSFSDFLYRPIRTPSLCRDKFERKSVLPVLAVPFSRRQSVRRFGSKLGSCEKGNTLIVNKQVAIPEINIDRLRNTLISIRCLIGYDTYDVSLFLVNDKEMRRTNYKSRGIRGETDILSFPFHEPTNVVGVVEEPLFDIPDYYQLGDMMIDVPYVIRRCLEDQEENESMHDQGIPRDEIERGVSGAMSTVYDAETRINMLLVHGMLHLVGYDHETEDEYRSMVAEEERILQELGNLKQPQR